MREFETIKQKLSGSILQAVDQMRSQGVQPDDDRKWLYSYLEEKCRDRFIPWHGKFELTPMCNLDCRMCYVHLDTENYDEDELISTERWIKIFDAAREMGMLDATLTGGECLTHPGFDKLYLHLYNHGIPPGVLSNGVLIDEQRTAFLKRYPPKFIQITLYGCSEEAYEAVTGHRVYQRVKKNIERLRDAGLRVMISMTPNAYSIDDPYEMTRITEEFNIPSEINFAMLSPRKDTGRERTEASEEMMMDLYRARKEYREIQITSPDLCDLPKPNQGCGENVAEGVLCGAGISGFTILHNGRMSACVGLGDTASVKMDNGFRAAWKELNDMMKRYPRPAECDQCAYRKVCLPCPAVHLEAPKGHCDTRICQRVYRMAAEGLL